MNREKYINDISYREGYLDGRREGAHAFEKAVKPYVEKIQKDIADLEEECIELEKDFPNEIEEPTNGISAHDLVREIIKNSGVVDL